MATDTAPFRNPDLPTEQRIDDLITRLTSAEKIDIIGFAPGNARLGLTYTPIAEGYHGVAQGGPSNWGKIKPTPTTQFPQAYGLASTWDPALLQRVAANQAEEARYLFQSPKYQRSGLLVMAPNADLARDPRWGRTEEVYGEDPYLAGTLAAAFARGLRGDDPRYLKATCLLKHFLANSNENGRFHTSSDFDERLWREYYAKAFHLAIRDGGARSMMLAYNAHNGTPCHLHPMVRDIVIGEWGLDGTICSDGGAVTHLVNSHQAFPSLTEASAAVIKAGVNHFLDRTDGILPALEQGLLTEADLDAAIRGRLRLCLDLGFFDPPERVPYSVIGHETDGTPEPWDRPATRALVREVTAKSIVLLRNEDHLLPLDPATVGSVAVVGPWANLTLLDWYSGTPPYQVTPRDGIEAYSAAPSMFEPSKFGVMWAGDMSDTAVKIASEADVAIVCLGNHPEGNAGWGRVTSPSEGKEEVDRASLDLDPAQLAFLQRVRAVNPRTVLALIANFPYTMPWAVQNVPAILQLTHASQEQGNGLADVLFGTVNPGGKTIQTWPKSINDLPPMLDYNIRHGRTYMYAEAEPQFPFGYGLSYTTFTLADASAQLSTDGATTTVTVQLTNTGDRPGDEVVQVYARYPQSAVDRPRQQLVGYARTPVEPGATVPVEITIPTREFAYWNIEAQAWTLESLPIELHLGTSSAELPLALTLTPPTP
ncbi:glycoside hydrolase family 3 C-terminal domain-containing protein [Actomonas aquatica]|uniref:Glycoside hydrolase family 3 C-terminal domain-containing protein n=1 Tax=Actomonas aquatica TaxID=2866162 RepID=A0ABZ1C3C8_9BACT|nr:glycoside hydrolase family 3 C-terminal domain-containing protein [Opitutus sp. WL0086]WRQ85852.1 glycoside hydrolase family 3 C-terminal domain-containing protein [Opitutus sp. WL0086]